MKADIKQPYNFADETGIWHVPVKQDGSIWLAPIRLCDYFAVDGVGIDDGGIKYYIIRVGMEADGDRCIIPRGDVGTNEGWRHLRNYINIPSRRQKLDLLTDFIQDEAAHTESDYWRVTDTAGWHGDSYIFPNGDIIGLNECLYFAGKISHNKRSGYAARGTLQQWQDKIARYAAGNSRFCLMLGAAFAAPLMEAFRLDGGIIHLYGDSSSGKTTAQRVGQSVWGHGAQTSESWNTTTFALTNNAVARHHGLLSLDEIGEDGSGYGVEQSIYALANGKGRAQGNKDGGNRPEIVFRVLSTSTGEITLEDHLRSSGKSAKAGQLVRCPSVPHRMEQHHDFADIGQMITHLRQATSEYYGTAGRTFIAAITGNKDHWISQAETRFALHYAMLGDAFTLNPQTSRTAQLFAACMTGLELACNLGIVPFPADRAVTAIKQAFADWLESIGAPAVSYEADAIIRKAVDFVQTNHLFFLNPDSPVLATHDFPGYVKRYLDDREDEYFIFPKVFREKICSGYNENKVKEVLHSTGWLKKNSDNRWLFQLYGVDVATKKRKRLDYFYKVEGIAPLPNLPS